MLVVSFVILSVLLSSVLIYNHVEKYKLLGDFGEDENSNPLYQQEKVRIPRGGMKYGPNSDYRKWKQRIPTGLRHND